MSNMPALFQLDGKTTTLVITHNGELPELAWFGHRLQSNIDANMLALLEDAALPAATLNDRAPLTLIPSSSSGHMGSAALLGHTQNAALPSAFTTTAIEQNDHSINCLFTDELSQLELTLRVTLEPDSDVVRLASQLRNTGQTHYWVDWLASATVPLPTHFTQCITQHGRWGLEFQGVAQSIDSGRIDISNQHGRTGHEHAPSVICASEDSSLDHGDALFAHLGWSGNYSMRIERLHDGTGYLQAGVLLSPGEERLSPNQTLTCPPLYITRGAGFNQCSQNFHRHARQHILPKWTRKPRPIHANSWEALYFDLNDDDLRALVDAAAAIGAERFILDDGWFPARRDDTAGLGDWSVDTGVFPNGLAPLVNHVRSHNMQFGLWFEPEMVNPDSELFRAHPEWVLHFDGIDTPLARHQLVLDVARDDVSDYLYDRIVSLVKEFNIDYIKWDMNRDLVLPGNGQFSRASRQPPAVYALMQRISKACPSLEIESCSSGGARCDFGVLQSSGRVWASDNIDPVSRSKIQLGFAQFFPPEIMGAHVGHKKAHLTDRETSLHTRAIVALQGQFGFELDARTLSADEIATLHHYTQLYKQHRQWLSDATYWQLPNRHNAVIASGLVAGNSEQALFTVVVLDDLPSTKPGHQRLRGLQNDLRYQVSLASINVSEFESFNTALPSWCNEPIVCTGEVLMHIGLPLPVLPPQQALLIHCATEAH